MIEVKEILRLWLDGRSASTGLRAIAARQRSQSAVSPTPFRGRAVVVLQLSCPAHGLICHKY